MKFSQCEYCLSWIPKKYLGHHESVCLVRRGIKAKPDDEQAEEKTYTAKEGESIQDLLKRMRKK